MKRRFCCALVLALALARAAAGQTPVRVLFEPSGGENSRMAASLAKLESRAPVRFTSFFDLGHGEDWRHIFERRDKALFAAYRKELSERFLAALREGAADAVVVFREPVSVERDAALVEFVRGGGMLVWVGFPKAPDATRPAMELLPVDVASGGMPRMPTDGGNLLSNGDFEDGTDGWRLRRGADAKTVPGGPGKKGHCLHIPAGAMYEAVGANRVPVAEGDRFVLSFDWRQVTPQWGPNLHTGIEPSYPDQAAYPRGVEYEFTYFGMESGIRVENYRDPVFYLYTHQDNWRHLRALVTVRPGSGLKELRFWQNSHGTGEGYEIDNIRLERIRPGAPLPPPPKVTGHYARADCALLAGVPLEALPVTPFALFTPQVGPDDRVLAETALGFPVVILRRFGKGRVLFFPLDTDGLLFPRAPSEVWQSLDSDAIWALFWERMLALQRPGAAPSAGVAPAVLTGVPGRPLEARLSLAHWQGKVRIALCDREGRVAAAAEGDPPPGKTADAPLPAMQLPPDLPGGDCLLKVFAGDPERPAGLAVVRVAAPLQLAISTEPAERKGWRPGESVRFVCTVNGALQAPAQGAVRLAVWDHQHRAVHAAGKPVRLTPGKGSVVAFDWTMPDLGPAGWFFWVTAQCDAPAQAPARAQTRVDRFKKYSFREDLHWSPWTRLEGRFARAAIPSVLRLFEDAGLNALGHSSGPEDHFWARRWGLRQYAEVPHFGGIDNIGWPEDSIEAFLAKKTPQFWPRILDNSVVAVASYGEEPGYGPAYGATWHWGDGPAPEGATRWLRRYLGRVYQDDIGKLNAQWGTQFGSFDEIMLEKEHSLPGKHFEVLPKGYALPANLSRHVDTHAFYHWYFQTFCHTLRDAFDRINPTSMAVMSMDNNFATQLDVVGMYNHWLYPKEWSACWYAYQRQFAKDPAGFLLNWGFFEDERVNAQLYLLSLTQGATAFSFWFDFPLQFNPDLTHTRGSLYFRRLRRQLAGREAALLLTAPRYDKELGIYIPRLDWKASMGRPAWLLGHRDLGRSPPWAGGYGGYEVQFHSALCESGYAPRFVAPEQFGECKVIFAPYCQSVPPEDARRLQAFVEAGGTLVASPKLATHDVHGKPSETAPGEGFAELFGVTCASRLSNTYGLLVLDDDSPIRFPEGHLPGGEPYRLQSFGRQDVTQVAEDVTVLARHQDGQPGILLRKVGKGTALYLNFVYFWPEEWYTFFSQGRESFRAFVCAILQAAGVGPSEHFLEKTDGHGSYAEPAWAVYPYETMPSGTRYLRLYADWRAPATDARLVLRRPVRRVFDVLRGREAPLRRKGDAAEVWLHLEPAEARVLALVEAPAAELRLALTPAAPAAGQTPTLAVSVIGRDGQPVSNARPITIETRDGSGARVAMLSRHVAVKGAATLPMPLAWNDAGTFTVTAFDTAEGLRGRLRFTVKPPNARPDPLPAAPPSFRGREGLPLAGATDAEFLSLLRGLRDLYRAPDASHRDLLAHFYCFPSGRHAKLERLWRFTWPRHAAALREALARGETLVLLPEDLGIDPIDGSRLYAHFDGKQVAAVEQLLQREDVTVLGSFTLRDYLVARVGKGFLILVAHSPDRAGWSEADVQAWHRKLLEDLETLGMRPDGVFAPAAGIAPMPGKVDLRSWLGASGADGL